jgi:uncharacterized protein (TIGR00299 family) protein
MMSDSTPIALGADRGPRLPMRIAYLDCFSGISGDMFLGALLDADAGVSPRLLEETVAALDVGARIEITRVLRAGVSASKVDVIVRGQREVPADAYAGHQHTHSHGVVDHDHAAEERGHGTSHEHGHAHRGLQEIGAMIQRTPISEVAKQRAIAMFETLGRAEARIHNTDIDRVHFHEVGSEDAIIDIVCAAVGSEALGVDEWVCSPLNVGGGTVQCAHGTLPVPVPATLEILKECGAPVYSGEVHKELVTPTGAAIVSVLTKRFEPMPKLRVDRIGYGAGYRDLRQQPNVLRVVIGETEVCHSDTERSTSGGPFKPDFGFSGEVPPDTDTITILETNIDDLNPQVFGYVMERALAMGALDVFSLPVQMKKNRQGTLLTVLCRPEDASAITNLLFAETSTLGVRTRTEQRRILARRHVSVQTPWGDVRIKVGSLNGKVSNYAPEYEDCRRVASEHGVPLKRVMQEAVRLFLEAESQAGSGQWPAVSGQDERGTER